MLVVFIVFLIEYVRCNFSCIHCMMDQTPSRSMEKLHATITELEEVNAELKMKYKKKKQQAEAIAKELEELTNEFNRSKQAWTHQEFELKRAMTETQTAMKGLGRLMNQAQSDTLNDLMARNQQILTDNVGVLNTLPQSLQKLTQTVRIHKEKTRAEVVEPMKRAFDKVIEDMEVSRKVELENQKQQYQYWISKKDEMLEKMTGGFNKYREKKSSQLRRCEQEIVKLYTYAEKLEKIIKQAEAGKFYMQTTQIGGGGGCQHDSTALNGGRTAGILIPKSTMPIRPGTTSERGGLRSGDLELSQRIVRKHQEHVEKDEKVKTAVMESLLVQYGALGESSDNEVIDPALHDQIKTLISSPSVGRDIIATASSQTSTRANTARGDGKQHALFASAPPGDAPRERPRHTTTSGGSTQEVNIQCPPARAVQALTQRRSGDSRAARPASASHHNRERNRYDREENKPSDSQYEQFVGFVDEGSMPYSFVGDEVMDTNGRVRRGPEKKTDDAMIFSPTSTAPGGSRGTHRPESVEEVLQLRTELEYLKDKLAMMEQTDAEKILESVEGNETLAYIKQLEDEREALRVAVKETTTQLQTTKVKEPQLCKLLILAYFAVCKW